MGALVQNAFRLVPVRPDQWHSFTAQTVLAQFRDWRRNRGSSRQYPTSGHQRAGRWTSTAFASYIRKSIALESVELYRRSPACLGTWGFLRIGRWSVAARACAATPVSRNLRCPNNNKVHALSSPFPETLELSRLTPWYSLVISEGTESLLIGRAHVRWFWSSRYQRRARQIDTPKTTTACPSLLPDVYTVFAEVLSNSATYRTIH